MVYTFIIAIFPIPRIGQVRVQNWGPLSRFPQNQPVIFLRLSPAKLVPLVSRLLSWCLFQFLPNRVDPSIGDCFCPGQLQLLLPDQLVEVREKGLWKWEQLMFKGEGLSADPWKLSNYCKMKCFMARSTEFLDSQVRINQIYQAESSIGQASVGHLTWKLKTNSNICKNLNRQI